MIKQLAYGVAAAALAAVAACSPGTDTATTDTTTTTTTEAAPVAPAMDPAAQTAEFANAVAMANTLEIEASKIAQTKSRNADVKAYAAMLVKEHTAAQAKLNTWATASSMTMPAALDSSNQMLIDNLANAGAAGFDDKYLDTVIDGHEAAISKTETYASNGADPALKQTAAELLPTLRTHFDRAKSIRDAVNRT